MQARVAVLAVLILVFSLLSPVFLTTTNLTNVLVNASVVGILAIGLTLLLVAQQVDVSVGSAVAFSAAVFAVTAQESSLFLAAAAALVAALAVAAVNAFAIVKLRVSSVIVTLAGFVGLRGAAKLVLNGRSVPVDGWEFLGRGRIHIGTLLEIPIPVIILFAVFLFYFLLMSYTRYGRHMYAIGANQEASRLAGIRLEREVAIAFFLCGGMAALAAVVSLSQIGAAGPTTGEGVEFLALTAVILGGASLHGGSGSVVGTVVAVVILAVLDNGMVLLGVPSFWVEVARGLLLLGAVIFDELGRDKDIRLGL
jgi:ribose/xylose/arabinose/galactoside ABC-type transport system permease subunit